MCVCIRLYPPVCTCPHTHTHTHTHPATCVLCGPNVTFWVTGQPHYLLNIQHWVTHSHQRAIHPSARRGRHICVRKDAAIIFVQRQTKVLGGDRGGRGGGWGKGEMGGGGFGRSDPQGDKATWPGVKVSWENAYRAGLGLQYTQGQTHHFNLRSDPLVNCTYLKLSNFKVSHCTSKIRRHILLQLLSHKYLHFWLQSW